MNYIFILQKFILIKKKVEENLLARLRARILGPSSKNLGFINLRHVYTGRTNRSRVRTLIVDHLMRLILVMRSFYEYSAVGAWQRY